MDTIDSLTNRDARAIGRARTERYEDARRHGRGAGGANRRTRRTERRIIEMALRRAALLWGEEV